MTSSPSSSESEGSPSSSPTPLSLSLSTSNTNSQTTNAPPLRTGAHKKDKKNVREKRRRGELNRKFDTLRELLAIGEGKSKVEKSHILSEAITAIETLKKRNNELTMYANQLGGNAASSNSLNTLARANPMMSSPASLAPFMNMLPALSSASTDPASLAASNTLLAQMAQAAQFPRSQQSQSNNQTTPLQQSSHAAFMNQLSSLSMPNALPNPSGSTNTPTPLPYGNNNPAQQSFPSFAAQQMSPSLAFTQQLQQQFAHQQMQHQFQQMQQQQHSASMSVINNTPGQQGMLGLPSAQSITRGSSHASLNDSHSANNQPQHR